MPKDEITKSWLKSWIKYVNQLIDRLLTETSSFCKYFLYREIYIKMCVCVCLHSTEDLGFKEVFQVDLTEN